MAYIYKIVSFDPQQGTLGIQFEGQEAYNYMAPFIDGKYLTGTALHDYIQVLYPQTLPYEQRLALVENLTGGDEIITYLPKPVVLEDIPSSPSVVAPQ